MLYTLYLFVIDYHLLCRRSPFLFVIDYICSADEVCSSSSSAIICSADEVCFSSSSTIICSADEVRSYSSSTIVCSAGEARRQPFSMRARCPSRLPLLLILPCWRYYLHCRYPLYFSSYLTTTSTFLCAYSSSLISFFARRSTLLALLSALQIWCLSLGVPHNDGKRSLRVLVPLSLLALRVRGG
jgi:hypothetical protein